MGGKWSKRAAWQAARERMVRTDGVKKHGVVTSSNTQATNAACAWLEAQEDEEVGFSVKPSLFKRKGGTGRDNYTRLLP
uniref:Truncated nef protein n=1 Tax=Human immunodeficiency virus type 1 TaxID=11676 RepID=B6V900_HV1|nr:truncated nef protein [Human immunodeficiency virus 1]